MAQSVAKMYLLSLVRLDDKQKGKLEDELSQFIRHIHSKHRQHRLLNQYCANVEEWLWRLVWAIKNVGWEKAVAEAQELFRKYEYQEFATDQGILWLLKKHGWWLCQFKLQFPREYDVTTQSRTMWLQIVLSKLHGDLPAHDLVILESKGITFPGDLWLRWDPYLAGSSEENKWYSVVYLENLNS